MKNNYDYTREKIRPKFLEYDQENMIHRFSLKHDDKFLWVPFAGATYQISRTTGEVKKLSPGNPHLPVEDADYEETLSIYDALCYGRENAVLGENWCLVNSLPGVGQNSGVGDNIRTDDALFIDRSPDLFRKVCEELNGKSIPWGDIGYEIPVFPFFPVRLRFYHSDEEFPAQLNLLFNEHTLEFMHYETTFYVAACLLRTIRSRMKEKLLP